MGPPRYFHLTGCGGKPAGVVRNQNRMTKDDSLVDFDARLRRFMARSLTGGASLDGRDETEFARLSLELFHLQFENNPAYRRLCEARGGSPASVSRWSDVPSVPASAFKELELTCLAPAERTTVFHSSGTTAQRPSRHFHSRESLALYEMSLIEWFRIHLRPEADAAFICLTPGGSQAPHSSLVHMFETVSRVSGPAQTTFCGGTNGDGAWTLNLVQAESVLLEAAAANRPVIVMGTAFNFVHLLDGLSGTRPRIHLPPGSCALETGGYKGRSRELAKPELHALLTERLGIPGHRIICEYGMSELSSQAYDLRLGARREARGARGQEIHSSRLAPHALRLFRFPSWARVQIISPETGREAGEGETGLVRVFDLANAWSVQAVQTEDLAVRRGDGFEWIGRAAASEPRGCSLMTV
jgi:hypothetical protein